jgi:hypothetical protein
MLQEEPKLEFEYFVFYFLVFLGFLVFIGTIEHQKISAPKVV